MIVEKKHCQDQRVLRFIFLEMLQKFQFFIRLTNSRDRIDTCDPPACPTMTPLSVKEPSSSNN